MLTITHALQHGIQEGLRSQYNSLCMTFPARWGMIKSDPCSLALSLSFSEYIGWYFDKSICGRSDAIMAMDGGISPRVWVNTLRLVPCLSWTYNLKGFFKSGSPKPRAETSFVFIVSKAFWHRVIQVGA